MPPARRAFRSGSIPAAAQDRRRGLRSNRRPNSREVCRYGIIHYESIDLDIVPASLLSSRSTNETPLSTDGVRRGDQAIALLRQLYIQVLIAIALAEPWPLIESPLEPVPIPMLPRGGPPPPKLRRGQKVPPPKPLKPIAEQIWPSTEFSSVAGSSRVVMTLSSAPLKKVERQVSSAIDFVKRRRLRS